MGNPLQAIMDIRKGERAFSFLMCGYFFLVITTFWILKPIKKAGFNAYYKAEGLSLFSLHLKAENVELLAKIANMLVAASAVVVFSWLARRFVRQQLSLIFTGFFLVCYLAFSAVINAPGQPTVWAFYLFGDLWSTLMVACFFVFLNDSVTAESAKRLYGLVGVGGVAGGFFGSFTVRSLVKSGEIVPATWIWICFGITVLIGFFAWLAARYRPVKSAEKPSEEKRPEPKKAANPALEGAKLVFKSKYLFSIVAIVGLYEIASQLIDFQFTATVNHYVAGEKLGEAYNNAFFYMNTTALIVQIFFTSFIMRRFGLMIALAVLPFMLLGVSVLYIALPVLGVGLLMPSSDGGFSYSINQSAKESLYVPATREEKYKAKAFIDMFVQRFAKVLAVVVSMAVTLLFTDFSSIRWLSAITIVIVFLWFTAVRYAGREFEKKAKKV